MEVSLDVQHLTVSGSRKGQNSIIKAIQDRNGFIWMAAIHGLYIHDGQQLRPALAEHLANATICDIHIDRRDTLWVATTTGLLSYSLLTDKAAWHRAGPGGQGLSSDMIFCVTEDRMGTIWVGTADGGLHRYNEILDTFSLLDVIPPAVDDQTKTKSVFDILEDARGNMWLSTNHGLLRLGPDRGAATIIHSESGDRLPVRKLAMDGKGGIWANPLGRGLCKVETTGNETFLKIIPEFSATQVWDILGDSRGDIWIGTKNGLYHVTEDQTLIRHNITATDQIQDMPANVASISELKAGVFAIGVWDSGVYLGALRPGARFLDVVTQDNGLRIKLQRNRCAYNPRDGRIYVAPVSGGLYRSQPVRDIHLEYAERIEVTQYLRTPRISALFVDSQQGMIASMSEYFLYIAPTGEITRVETPPIYTRNLPATFRCVSQAPNGRFWMAAQVHVCSWIPGEEAVTLHAKSQTFTGVTAVDGTAWITSTQGIFRLGNNATRLDRVLGTAPTTSIFKDTKGHLWVGTVEGLLRLDCRTLTPATVTLGSDTPICSVQSFWESPDGDIWFQNLDAVYVVRAGSDTATEMVAENQGPAQAITSSPMAILPGGTLVFGHTSGLLLVDPAKLTATSTPQTIISDLRIFDQPVAASNRGLLPSRLDLDYRQNYLTFGFGTPGFNHLRRPRYVYKLEGVDADWTQSESRDYATYAHLDPGSYTFLVREISGAHPPAALPFTIAPPWWLTPWAKTGYAVVTLMSIGAAFVLTTRLQAGHIRREMLETLVMQDPLTGIPNRRKFNEVLEMEKSRCKRTRCTMALIMIDVDYFKGFNDRFGHQAGDQALCAIARTLRDTLRRPEDFVARYGGEEFVIILPNTGREGAERVAKKIQTAMAEANIAYPGSPISDRITISLGISSFRPESDMHIESGLFSADQALYQAKRDGRNRFFYKELGANLALLPLCEKAIDPA